MKKLLNLIVTNLVDKPDEIEVNEEKDENYLILKLSVDKDDIGKVIGKKGKIIKAIKSILRIKAVKNHQKFYLQLADLEEPNEAKNTV